jgi:hypothetical protein
VMYFPPPLMWAIWGGKLTLEKLEPGAAYTGVFYNPCSGEEFPMGEVRGDAAGRYLVTKPPIFQDWVIVLKRA